MIKGFANTWVRVDFKITRMQNTSLWRINDQGTAFWNGMRNRGKPNLEWTDVNGFRPFHHSFDIARTVAVILHLHACQMRGKRAGENGRAYFGPQMPHSANMIFMSMRYEYRINLIAAFL